jgi:hypothetical protein
MENAPEMMEVLNNETLLFRLSSSIQYCSMPFPTSKNKEEIIKLPLHMLLNLKDHGAKTSCAAVDPSTSTICVASGKLVQFGSVQDKGDQEKEDDNLTDRVSWRELRLEDNIISLACSADILVTGEISGRIHVFFGMQEFVKRNLKPTETVLTWHQSPVTSLQISANGTPLLSSLFLD